MGVLTASIEGGASVAGVTQIGCGCSCPFQTSYDVIPFSWSTNSPCDTENEECSDFNCNLVVGESSILNTESVCSETTAFLLPDGQCVDVPALDTEFVCQFGTLQAQFGNSVTFSNVAKVGCQCDCSWTSTTIQEGAYTPFNPCDGFAPSASCSLQHGQSVFLSQLGCDIGDFNSVKVDGCFGSRCLPIGASQIELVCELGKLNFQFNGEAFFGVEFVDCCIN